MPRRSFEVHGERPFLDLVSHGRRGPDQRLHLLPAQIEQIARTVRYTPEVMVKISVGGSSAKAVAAHFNYLSRQEFEVEPDDGEHLKGKEAQRALLDDWELNLDAAEARSPYRGVSGRGPAKLVHNIVLSMPAGTSATGVLAASRAFARHLRAQGIAANATNRAIRGAIKPQKCDGIYRAMRAGRSTQLRERAESVAAGMRTGNIKIEPGKALLVATRHTMVRGWLGAAKLFAPTGGIDSRATSSGSLEVCRCRCQSANGSRRLCRHRRNARGNPIERCRRHSLGDSRLKVWLAAADDPSVSIFVPSQDWHVRRSSNLSSAFSLLTGPKCFLRHGTCCSVRFTTALVP